MCAHVDETVVVVGRFVFNCHNLFLETNVRTNVRFSFNALTLWLF